MDIQQTNGLTMGTSRDVELFHVLTEVLMFFPPQQNFAMGSLAQISSGAIRCSFNTRFRTRFRMALVQIPHQVPEGSGADTS